MSGNINFEKQTYIHNKAKRTHETHAKTLKSKPTHSQMQYHDFLLKLCDKYDVKGCPRSASDDRSSVGKGINLMIKNLTEAGIDVRKEFTKRRKYRFDKDGNVVEIATGKIVKRRDGK